MTASLPATTAPLSVHEADALHYTLALLEKKWMLLIVFRLLEGPQHFCQLRRGVPGMSAKILTLRLRELVDAGLVQRDTRGAAHHGVIYAVTAKGDALRPFLAALRQWGMCAMPLLASPCATCMVLQGTTSDGEQSR